MALTNLTVTMKTIRYSRRRKFPVINIFKNKVDKDVQSIFFPFNLMKVLSMNPIYCLKDDIIQIKIIRSYIIPFIGTLVYIILYMLRYVMINSIHVEGKTSYMDGCSTFDTIISPVGFIANYVIALFQIKNTIKFVLIFQNVHRFINDKSVSKSYIVWNWICLIMNWFIYIFVYPSVALYVRLNMLIIVISDLLIIFDFNEIYAIRMIKLLEIKILLWTHRVLNVQDIENGRKNYNQNLFQAYVDILKCYDIHKSCIHFITLYFLYLVVLYTLVYVEVIIESLKYGLTWGHMDVATSSMICVFTWLGKNFLWQSIMNWQCEKFYMAVQKAQDACTLVLMSDCSDDKKHLCKNVLRLHRASFSKIRVCGLFYLDASLQLSLMSLVANYTIVLLQFALL